MSIGLPGRRSRGVPTILLVHGAFAGVATWSGVLRELIDTGSEVHALAIQLRSLASDAEYVAAVVRAVDGPVILVGHSYGGAVITAVGTMAPNLAGLVSVAGFLLNELEACTDVLVRNSDQGFLQALRPVQLSTPTGRVVELDLRRDMFGSVFAADLDRAAVIVAAASQRPILAAALEERPGGVAWRAVPCWSLIPTADRVIAVDTHRDMAARAGAVVTEVEASHFVPASQPHVVAGVIRAAVDHLDPPQREGPR